MADRWRRGLRSKPLLRGVFAYQDDLAAAYEALVQERLLDRPAEEATRDEDAVAELQEGLGGDLGTRAVLVAPEGGAQDGLQAASRAVEGQARDQRVYPCDLRVRAAREGGGVPLFERPVHRAHHVGVFGDLTGGGGSLVSWAP